MDVQKGLIVRQRWIELILSGEKTWGEMRSNCASHRGSFGLILKGSKTVVGVANLVKARGPLTDEQLDQAFDRHRVPSSVFKNAGARPWCYAWELADVRRLPHPVPYAHKSEVRWVLFTPEVIRQIQMQLAQFA